MLINLEGPPLKSLLCEMGGATDAGQPKRTTPEVFTLRDGGATDAGQPSGTTPEVFTL